MNNNFDNEKKENMPIRTFVNKRLIGVYEDSTVQESAQKMVEFGISSLVVIDKGEVVGFFTDGDLKKKIVAEGRSPQTEVNNIMNT
ncbi:MAG TPA: CBS domain-containing protein, partial [Candidatus Mcinerneyibacterium sp.]|nr:CBS domain-containing protein [Candidatus Mcinerneyibacterium sp.]